MAGQTYFTQGAKSSSGCKGSCQRIPSGAEAIASIESPDLWLQSLPSRHHRLKAWQNGCDHLWLTVCVQAIIGISPGTRAACGGLKPPPARRLRGALPHHLCSTAARRTPSSCAPSWHTIVRIPAHRYAAPRQRVLTVYTVRRSLVDKLPTPQQKSHRQHSK